ncbi:MULTISPECIES: LPS-assembly protein LptD [unclassified Sphingomonas]|uniref:LPS-assembly protein LptD n=1 Tax=unclassified Sphingomonas TaxID=196159 RepID=UPI0006F27F5E|nr:MULTISPECIES: LPS assembly protein LptD [unclassified Sphingomonas]KQM67006.1 organic solvent tolerance protein [Sphingomonas sp. Leaf16]KQN17953.1 organic solvent tolerance protein [Sphingomonas sp. Leaf29]KQN23816.1 organic solvent tolerance protein [Sphingomonas sp. Leaf32]
MKRSLGSLALGLTLAIAGPAVAQDLQDRSLPPPPPESALPTPASEDQIDFSSDLLQYDSNADVVTATGEVRLLRDGNRLRADRVTWNRKTGQVVADGNIAITNPQGDIAYGDRIELTDSLKDGAVDNMLVVLDEGGRIAAKRGTRSENGVVTVESAAYTPCSVTNSAGCPKEPSWKITALKVRYDPTRKRIRYTGAGLTIFGLPTIPLPSFSHSIGDGSDSGLLAPSIRLDRVNGLEVAVPYYFNLAPNRDLTITPHVFTAVLPMLQADYRSLTTKGAYRVQGYGTVSRRSDDLVLGASPTGTERSFRGYVDAVGRFQLDPNWGVSGSLRYATDQTFLRRYDISRDDRLRNNVTVERIDRDSMLTISGWAVQTLRVGDDQGMQPVALPEIDYRRRFNGLLGGIAQVQLNTLAISRSEGQETQRAFAAARWDLTRYTPLGQEVTFTAYARADAYNARDTIDTAVLSYRGDEGFTPRGIAAVAVDVRWPFIGAIGRGTQRISPRVQLVASPKIANLAVPNEDARAVDLEDSNLFALNRFAGYDRFEDSSRVTYGLDYALDLPGVAVSATIGQSYRASQRASILPSGTGLDDRFSDFVGRTDIRFRELVTFTHRYRLDKDGLKIRRNELDATVGSRRTYVQVGYLRLNRDIDELEDLQDREEVRVAGRAAFGPFWSAFASATIDLTDKSEDSLSISDGFDPIRHRVGVQYEDDCLRLGLTWKRDYQRIGDARNGSSYLVTLALKNLGR